MRIVALVLALGLVAGGCGGDDGWESDGAPDDGASTTAVPSDTTVRTEPAEETGTTEDDHEGLTDLELVAPELLIRAAELGVDGAEELGYTPPAPASGCPTDLDADHPAEVHVGTTIAAGGVTIVESLRVFADAGSAATAHDAWVGADPSCRPADPAATTPVDVNEHVRADAATSFGSPAGDDVLVIAHLGDAVLSVRTTGVAIAADGAPLLPPLDVAAFAVGKLLAALEA